VGEGAHKRHACSPGQVACPLLAGHAHLTDFNIATIIKDGERATALAGTKPYMGKPNATPTTPPRPQPPPSLSCQHVGLGLR
jgi:hypothetical protein